MNDAIINANANLTDVSLDADIDIDIAALPATGRKAEEPGRRVSMMPRRGPQLASSVPSDATNHLSADSGAEPASSLPGPDVPASALTIRVSRGVGVGRTRLAAFDAALRSAGVADFNLVRLSSVIPPGSTVKEVSGSDQVAGQHGDLLYCVYADAYASTPHSEAWAGLAWSEAEDGSGAGLFVEHNGMSEAHVQADLSLTLEDLSLGRGGRFRSAGSSLASAFCIGHPVCALVIATYGATGWESHAR